MLRNDKAKYGQGYLIPAGSGVWLCGTCTVIRATSGSPGESEANWCHSTGSNARRALWWAAILPDAVICQRSLGDHNPGVYGKLGNFARAVFSSPTLASYDQKWKNIQRRQNIEFWPPGIKFPGSFRLPVHSCSDQEQRKEDGWNNRWQSRREMCLQSRTQLMFSELHEYFKVSKRSAAWEVAPVPFLYIWLKLSLKLAICWQPAHSLKTI